MEVIVLIFADEETWTQRGTVSYSRSHSLQTAESWFMGSAGLQAGFYPKSLLLSASSSICSSHLPLSAGPSREEGNGEKMTSLRGEIMGRLPGPARVKTVIVPSLSGRLQTPQSPVPDAQVAPVLLPEWACGSQRTWISSSIIHMSKNLIKISWQSLYFLFIYVLLFNYSWHHSVLVSDVQHHG